MLAAATDISGEPGAGMIRYFHVDNIKHGLIGTPQEHESGKAVRDFVERAAQMANLSTANGVKYSLRCCLYLLKNDS